MDEKTYQEKLRLSVLGRLEEASSLNDITERKKKLAGYKKYYGERFPDLFPESEKPPEKAPEKSPEKELKNTEKQAEKLPEKPVKNDKKEPEKEPEKSENIFPKTGDKNYDKVLEECSDNLKSADPLLQNSFLKMVQLGIEKSIAPLTEIEKDKLSKKKLKHLEDDPVAARQALFEMEQKKRDKKTKKDTLGFEQERPEERKPTLLSDFANLKIEPPKWVIEELFAEGINLCCSYPKEGKSYLVMNSSFSVLRNKKVLGKFDCKKAPVLHFALEDTHSELLERFKKMGEGLDSSDAGFFSIDNGPLTATELITDIKHWLHKKPETRLVVIDTLAKIQPEGNRNKSDYQNDVDFLGSLQRIAKQNRLGMVLVHHTTKHPVADDPFREIIGSVGLWGVADMACVLKPNPDEKTYTLFSKGRRGRYKKMAIEKEIRGNGDWNGWWNYLGEADKYMVSIESREVLKILEEHSSEGGIGPKEISQILGISEGAVNKRLYEMKKRKEINKLERGKWIPKL